MARNAAAVIAGTGLLYVGPTTATAPTEATVEDLDVLVDLTGWRELGYTESGATITTATTSENLEVAEEAEPIAVITTGRTGAVAFDMAQATVDNLGLALNLGANVANTTAKISPPDLEDEEYISIILQTPQGAVWYFPKTKNTAEFSMARAKTGKTLISVEMGIFKDSGKDFFAVFPGTDGAV